LVKKKIKPHGIRQLNDDTTVRDEQRAWLHDRNQCGADVPCLRQEYAARIEQLQQ